MCLKKITGTLLIFIFSITGCGYELNNLRNEFQEQRLPRKLPPIQGYHDLKGVIHIHTEISHDSKGKIKEIVEAAKRNKLDFVILTDHNDPKIFTEQPQGIKDGILFIRGSEIIKDKTDILAIAPKNFINKSELTWNEITAELRRQNALIIIAHPDYLYPDFEISDYDALEVYDIFDDVLTEKFWRLPKHLWNIICCYERYPEEIFLQILDWPKNALERWDEELQKRFPITAVAGNDSHQNVRLFGKQIDPYWLSFKMASTHVLTSSANETDILNGLKRGRAYISFDIVNRDDQFQFYGICDKKLIMMGDEVYKEITKDINKDFLNCVLRVNLTDEGKIRFLQNGKIIFEGINDRMLFPVKEPGIYRVEVERKIGNRWYPWIISNPIYIKQAL
ncbi:MAG: CehA/McbA family metallohydrolase [Patescibacteria group bacterium]